MSAFSVSSLPTVFLLGSRSHGFKMDWWPTILTIKIRRMFLGTRNAACHLGTQRVLQLSATAAIQSPGWALEGTRDGQAQDTGPDVS